MKSFLEESCKQRAKSTSATSVMMWWLHDVLAAAPGQKLDLMQQNLLKLSELAIDDLPFWLQPKFWRDITETEQPLFKCLITFWKEWGVIFFFPFSVTGLPLISHSLGREELEHRLVLRSPVCLTPNSVTWIRGPSDAVNKHLPLIGLLGAGYERRWWAYKLASANFYPRAWTPSFCLRLHRRV